MTTSFIIYSVCLIGAVLTSYYSGIKTGTEDCIGQLIDAGLIEIDTD